jgi:hypothetical protein
MEGIARGIHKKTLLFIFIFIIIPLIVSCLPSPRAAYIKNTIIEEKQQSSVHISVPTLSAGEFKYLIVTLTNEAQKISIIAYLGDKVPDINNRSIYNYYRWEYDQGQWLDKSGYSSKYIKPSKCYKKGNTYLFYIRLDPKAKPGKWSIKISIDNRYTSSTNLYLKGLDSVFLLSAIGHNFASEKRGLLQKFFRKHHQQKDTILKSQQESYADREQHLREIEKFIDDHLSNYMLVDWKKKVLLSTLLDHKKSGDNVDKVEGLHSSSSSSSAKEKTAKHFWVEEKSDDKDNSCEIPTVKGNIPPPQLKNSINNLKGSSRSTNSAGRIFCSLSFIFCKRGCKSIRVNKASFRKFTGLFLVILLIFLSLMFIYYTPKVGSLDNPHYFYGYVWYQNGSQVPAGTVVTLTDDNNGNSMTTTTIDLGDGTTNYYQADVSQIPGSADGDLIIVNCTCNNQVGENSTYIDISLGSQQVDVHLAPLAAPTSLQVSAATDKPLNSQLAKVSLSWTDNSDLEDGFKIERKINEGTFVEIASVGANVVSYVDDDLDDNTLYTYRVRAFRGTATSNYSNEAPVVTPDRKGPSTPDLTVTPDNSNNEIDLSWSRSKDEIPFALPSELWSRIGYGHEVEVYDDMNSADESTWVRVTNTTHTFTGRIVVQNGLIRTKFYSASSQYYPTYGPYVYIWDGSSYIDYGTTSRNIFYTTGGVTYKSWTDPRTLFNTTLVKNTPDEVQIKLEEAHSNAYWLVTYKRGKPTYEFKLYENGSDVTTWGVYLYDRMRFTTWSYSGLLDLTQDFLTAINSYQISHGIIKFGPVHTAGASHNPKGLLKDDRNIIFCMDANTDFTYSNANWNPAYMRPTDNEYNGTAFYFGGYPFQTTQLWADAEQMTQSSGVVQRILDPASSSTNIKLVSDNATDTMITWVTGIVSGSITYESITLNGTTEVSGVKDFTKILYIDFASVPSGTITIKDSLNNVLGTISSRWFWNGAELDAQYEKVNRTITLPSPGEYRMVVAEQSTAAVSGDLNVELKTTSGTVLGSSTFTTSTSRTKHYFDITLTSDDLSPGNTLVVEISKATNTTNTISVDWFVLVPKKVEAKLMDLYGIYRSNTSSGTYEPLNGLWDDFNDGNDDGWVVSSGNWTVTNGEYNHSDSTGPWHITTRGNTSWTDYVAKTEFKIINGTTRAIKLIMRAESTPTNHVGLVYREDTNQVCIYNYKGGYYIAGYASATKNFADGEWHTLKGIVINQTYRLYIDDILQIEGTDTGLSQISFGKIGLGAVSAHAHFDDVSVTLLLRDADYTDSDAKDVSTPDQATGLSSSTHTLSTWSNDPTVTVNWNDAIDNGDDYFYYIKAFDDEGNDNNLLTYGTIEKGTLESTVPGWGANLKLNDTQAYSGSRSGVIVKLTTGEATSQHVALPIPDNTIQYRFGGYVYSDGPSVDIYFFSSSTTNFYDGTYDYVRTYTTGKWVYMEGTSTNVVNTDNYFTVRVDNNGGGTVWFDNIFVYPVKSATVTTGLAGYAVSWTHGAQDITFETINVSAGVETVTSPSLSSANDWYFNIRSCDNAGNWAPSTETVHYGPFWIDVDEPSSSIDTPADGAYYKSLTNISGTASDATSGVASVTITIYNATDRMYWNGTAWVASAVQLSTTGTTSWYRNSGLPSWAYGKTYIVNSTATDAAGNVESTPDSNSFTYDNIKPAISFIPPTPDNNLATKNNWVYLNTTITDLSNTSAFFDWNRSLVGYWSFDFYNSTGVFDNSTYGNFGVFNGGLGPDDLVVGKYGKALTFDGVDDYIAIKNLHYDTANEITKLTVSAWVKVPTTGGDWSIVDFDRSEYYTCAAGIPSGSATGEGDYVGFHTTAAGYGIVDMWSNTPIRDGKWHFITWVYDSSDVYDKKIYIDGVLDAQQDAYPTGVGLGSGTVRYGFIGDGSEASTFNGTRNGFYFEGTIDEVRIYHRVLGPEEINASYNNALYRLYHNFTSLSDTTYNYSAYAIDEAGNLNITSTRTVTVDTTKPIIAWEPPTPSDGSTTNNNWVYLNTTITDATNTSAFFDWNNSLVGYWSFDYYNSTHVFDNSTYRNNGTFQGTNFGINNITTGKYGKGLQFDGVDDCVEVVDDNSLRPSEALTITAWFYRVSGGTSQHIIAKQYGTSYYDSYALWISSTDNIGFVLSDGTANTQVSTAAPPLNEWHFVAGVWDGSVMSLYLDGEFAGSASFSGIVYDSNPVLIGADDNNADDIPEYIFNGTIDEVCIYSRALSREEINASYNNGLYRLYHNFTGLNDGTYSYTAYAIDEAGNLNITSTRTVTVSTNKAPVINSYDLRNSSGSKLNGATGLLDVNHEYYFQINITDENGWADIQYINITAWYDNGNESTTYNNSGNLGGNLNMFLQYKNTTGTASFTMIWPNNEAELVLANCSETIVTSTTRIIKISFKPESQVRYANTTGGWNTTQNATNDLNSWNFRIDVVDTKNAHSWVVDEYGVYRYTFIQPNQNWIDVVAQPGDNDTSNVVTITYSSNYGYNITIWFEENLTNQTWGTTIPIAGNVDILNGTDPNDDITPSTGDITFNGIGEINAVDIINVSGTFEPDGVTQTVDVQFNVRIPLGTMWGIYQAHVGVKIFQKQ